MADSRILVAVREHPRNEGAGSQQWAGIGQAIKARGFDVRIFQLDRQIGSTDGGEPHTRGLKRGRKRRGLLRQLDAHAMAEQPMPERGW